jgi:hypothetical protein
MYYSYMRDKTKASVCRSKLLAIVVDNGELIRGCATYSVDRRYKPILRDTNVARVTLSEGRSANNLLHYERT